MEDHIPERLGFKLRFIYVNLGNTTLSAWFIGVSSLLVASTMPVLTPCTPSALVTAPCSITRILLQSYLVFGSLFSPWLIFLTLFEVFSTLQVVSIWILYFEFKRVISYLLGGVTVATLAHLKHNLVRIWSILLFRRDNFWFDQGLLK